MLTHAYTPIAYISNDRKYTFVVVVCWSAAESPMFNRINGNPIPIKSKKAENKVSSYNPPNLSKSWSLHQHVFLSSSREPQDFQWISLSFPKLNWPFSDCTHSQGPTSHCFYIRIELIDYSMMMLNYISTKYQYLVIFNSFPPKKQTELRHPPFAPSTHLILRQLYLCTIMAFCQFWP